MGVDLRRAQSLVQRVAIHGQVGVDGSHLVAGEVGNSVPAAVVHLVGARSGAWRGLAVDDEVNIRRWVGVLGDAANRDDVPNLSFVGSVDGDLGRGDCGEARKECYRVLSGLGIRKSVEKW